MVKPVEQRPVAQRKVAQLPLLACLLALWIDLPTALAYPQSASAQTARVHGVVRDQQGKPISEVSVVLQPVTLENDGRGNPPETKTNAQGAFVFEALVPGNYKLKASRDGFLPLSDDSISLAPGENKACDLVLIAAQSPSSLSPTRPPPIQFDDRPNFTVSGVTDSTGSGGHGSETRMRTGEVLAKETVNLESGTMQASSEDNPGEKSALGAAQEREHVRDKLAHEKDLATHDAADLHRHLGDLDERLDDPLGAEKEYERAADLDANEQNYFAWGAELLLHRAAAPAIDVFGKGARLHPKSARMLAGLAAALYTSGSAEEAAHRLCDAANLDPMNATPYLFLGKIQETTPALLPCAEPALARFAHDEPANALANYYYALALWKRDRGAPNAATLRQSEALLEKAAAIDPKLDMAYLQLGDLHAAQGAFLQAISAYEKAIAANQSNSQAHYRLGLAYKRIGEETKAQMEFERYKQLDQSEAVTIERQRRELRQFLFVLKDQSATPH